MDVLKECKILESGKIDVMLEATRQVTVLVFKKDSFKEKDPYDIRRPFFYYIVEEGDYLAVGYSDCPPELYVFTKYGSSILLSMKNIYERGRGWVYTMEEKLHNQIRRLERFI